MPEDIQSLPTLHIAFIWHMHQPDYKDSLTGDYLMPWVRLHGIKDYLDMVCILEQYPRIKQTFNLVPSLIEQLNDYTKPETVDPVIRVTQLERFSDEDKRYILTRCFDASSDTM